MNLVLLLISLLLMHVVSLVICQLWEPMTWEPLTSSLSGRLSDGVKYKVLKQLDQTQRYKFHAALKGGHAVKTISRPLVLNYPRLAHSKSENGRYCACCVFTSHSHRQ